MYGWPSISLPSYKMHKFPGGGGGGGMSHWGLYIIRLNHSLKGTLNEDEATILTALGTRHRACAPGYRRIAPKFHTLSADRQRTCPGDLWIWYPFFIFSCGSIPLTQYACYAPGGEKDTLFTRFYLRGWCTGPNETFPPPPPPRGINLYSISLFSHKKIYFKSTIGL